MSYTVNPLPDEASYYDIDFYSLFEYILKDVSCMPLPGDVSTRFSNTIMPKAYEQINEKILNLTVYEDDVWIVTFPKCGTTWTQEAIWQICNDVDIENRGKEPVSQRFPFLEMQAAADITMHEIPFEFINDVKRPRFIKSHLPICFLPKQLWTVKPKIIYVARDPKDAAISFYHHCYNFYKYSGTKEQFLDIYLKGLVVNGNYWDHLEQFYLLQSHYPQLKIITYENMKHNLEGTLNELCTFFNKVLTDEQIQRLVQHLQFKNMKKNTAINLPNFNSLAQANRPGSEYTFLRRGDTGSLKDEMPLDNINKFNEVAKKRLHSFGIYQNVD